MDEWVCACTGQLGVHETGDTTYPHGGFVPEIRTFPIRHVEGIELKWAILGAEPFIPYVEAGNNDQETGRIPTGRPHIYYLEKSPTGCALGSLGKKKWKTSTFLGPRCKVRTGKNFLTAWLSAMEMPGCSWLRTLCPWRTSGMGWSTPI